MDLGYCSAAGISLSEEIKTIPKKSKNPLQPVFEALMNSFEAIKNLKKVKLQYVLIYTRTCLLKKTEEARQKNIISKT